MVTLEVTWSDHEDVILLKVASEKLRPQLPTQATDFERLLIQRCWKHDPESRLSFDEILAVCKVIMSKRNVQYCSAGRDR